MQSTIHFQIFGANKAPIAQMADIGFKVVLLERLNQKWKQNHLQNPCNKSKNQGGDHV